MARGILPDVAVQHESDSRLRSGLSSAAGRAEAGRGRAQQFRGEPILRTDNGAQGHDLFLHPVTRQSDWDHLAVGPRDTSAPGEELANGDSSASPLIYRRSSTHLGTGPRHHFALAPARQKESE
jgi:hypothetical protein